MSNKAAEVIADAATPAVETAMQIGEKIAESIGQPVEVVFEVIQKTPLNVKRTALIVGGLVVTGALAGAGYWYWTKKRAPKKVINGEIIDNNVDEELNEMIKNEASQTNGSKKK